MASRADWPCYASGLDFVRPRQDGIPNGVNLPTYLNNGYGFSGQNAGVLGPRFDPWHIKQDPNERGFRVEDLSLPVGLTVEKVGRRRALLAEIDGQATAIDRHGTAWGFGGIQDKAFTMLTSGNVKRAFELVAARIPPGSDAEAVTGVLSYAAAHRSEFMWPWETAPRSIAHGILDDETYDWLSIVRGLIDTGGYPVVVSEGRLLEASALVLERARANVDETGAAGLAGVIDLLQTGEVGAGETVGVILSGVRR